MPVTSPDLRARTQAVQVLLDQGYGRPATTVHVEPLENSLARSIREMSDEERARRYEEICARLPGGLFCGNGAVSLTIQRP